MNTNMNDNKIAMKKAPVSIIVGVIALVVIVGVIMSVQRKSIKSTEEVIQDTTSATSTATTTPKVDYAPAVAFEGTTFKLVAINGKLAPKGDYAATFSEGRVQAKFCNNLAGAYTLNNYVVKAPFVTSTLMFCEQPEGLMQIEQTFGKMLAEGATITVTGDVLELKTKTDQMVFQEGK